MGRFNSESDFQESFAERLEGFGWDVQREVWSDCRSGRADVVSEHPSVGRVAFELKVLDGATGKPAAEAVKQLSKYRDIPFDGKPIDFWALAIYASDSVTEREKRLLQSMFNDLGFGFVRWRSIYKISFAMGKKIPMRSPESVNETELSRIRRRVENHSSDW